MVAALRSLLVATAFFAVLSTTAFAQDPACDRTWTGGSGNWGDGAHWVGGVPASTERACLPAGSYTVTMTAGSSPKGATVGAGVTLLIQQFQYLDARTASFINHGTVRLEQNATLYGPLTNDGTVEDTGTIPVGNNRPNINGAIVNTGTIRANQGLNLARGGGSVESTGKLETANADALLNGFGDPDGIVTLGGTLVNPGTIQFQSGTLRMRGVSSQTGNPPKLYDGKLDLTGAAASTVEANNTVDLITDIPAGVTVRAIGRTNDANLRLDANRTNNGTLVLDSSDVNRSAQVSSSSGIPRLTNNGTLRVGATAGTDRYLRIPITNTATGTLTVDAGTRLVFYADSDLRESILAGTMNVNGNLWVQTGNTQLTQTGGALTIGAGATLFFQGSRYVHQGGTVTGELQFQNNSSFDASGPGAVTYHVVGVVTLAGDVNAAATINADAVSNGAGYAQLTFAAARTMAGRLIFTSTGPNTAETEVNGGGRLTVTGRVDVQRGTGGVRHFKNPLTVASGGQFNVEALSTALLDGQSAQTHQLAGTVDVAGGAYFGVRSGPHTVTQTAGTISGLGAFAIEGGNTFVHQGGAVTGDLQISNNGILDPSGPGAATYHVVGVATLAGDVNAAATINAESSGGNQAQLNLAAPRTIAGRVSFTTAGANAQDTGVNGTARLTVTGRIDIQKGQGGIRNFTVPLTIAASGQFNVGADASVYVNGNGNVLDHQLAGTVSVANGGLLLFRTADQTVTQTAGTITVGGTGSFVVEGNAFVHQGGSAVGRVTVSSSNVNGRLDPSGPGTMAYLIANSVNLIADVSANASIELGTDKVGGQLYVRDKDVTNRGSIVIGQANSQYAGTLSDLGQPYTLTNAGSITASKGAQQALNLRVINTGTLTVNDTFGGNSAIAGQPLVTNSGGTVTINKAGFTTWGGYTQTSGLTDIIDGSLGSPRNPADIQILGGRLRGTGVLFGPVTNAATVEIGRAGTYGKLAINDVVDQIVRVGASYTQTATGRLAVDVGGKVAGTSFDQLSVQGPVTLNGALDLTTAAGYTPNPATPDKYRVLVSETRANTFAGASGSRSYTIGYPTTADPLYPAYAAGVELTARVPPPASAELTVANATVVEGSGPLTFTVKLDKAATDVVTADWYTEDDSATAPGDYTASTGKVTFPVGSTSQTFTVPVTNDTVIEPTKELVVRLRNPVNAIFEYPTAIGTINPDDVGITNSAPTTIGNAGAATITITGGGFAPGTTAKLTRPGSTDRKGVITSGPDRQSKFGVRFDMSGAAQGAWVLTVTAPSGTSVTTPITVQNSPAALYSVLSVPSALRFGWVATATLSLRNAGTNDVGIDGVRFVGSDLELRAPGTTTFSRSLVLSDTDLGDALVVPALSTRTVLVEVRSTTTVGHAFMSLDAEVYPAGYLSQTIAGSDLDPGTGSIAGHVTNASGQPVRGLLVSGFDGSHSASATTDGSGAYTLKTLKPGTYKVEAGGASGSAAVNANAASVDLVTGVADLSGSVGKGDATVALLRAGKAVALVAADATGGFRFRIAKAGAYTVVADSPSSGRASQAVTVVAGVDQPGLRLTLGTRTLNVTAGSGAVVRVWPTGEQDLPSSRTAGAGGVASFTGLGAGALTVEARAAGKAPTRVTVAAGATTATVTPATAASISGLVSAGATPVVAAAVVAVAPTGGEQFIALTGVDGRYTISGPAAGTYDVWVLANGYAPQVKRGITTGTTTANAAVVKTGAALDVRVGDKRLGALVQALDPATRVIVATATTAGTDGIASLGPLPAGTYAVVAPGAAEQSVTVAGSPAKAARAAVAQAPVTLDEDGYPVVEDPEHDPAYDEYTSPWSQLKFPLPAEKDRLHWDDVTADYPGPCPTADRLFDTILLKSRAKVHAFQAWIYAWNAIDEQNSADEGLYLSKFALLSANTIATVAMMGKAPAGVSPTLVSALQNGANYLGTLSQTMQGGSVGLVDAASGFKDLIDFVATAQAEAAGGPSPVSSYLSSLFNILRQTTELYNETAAFADDVKARGDSYLQAQAQYLRLLEEINDLINQYNEVKKHCPDPTDKGPKPPVSNGGRIENITSNDPNEILGPVGAGDAHWIPRSQVLGYTIRFENLGPGSTIPPGQQPASAPATTVKVVTTLSPSVDVDQVTLGNVGWGAVELSVPAGRTSYHADYPLTDGDIVRVDGALNKAARTITWTLKTIDPATGEVDGSPTAGFLPPEDGTRRGQGHVDYRAGTPDTVAQGTAIAAKATITFDVNPPIDTNTHSNSIDGSAPTSSLTLGTPSCDGKLPVQWTGSDSGSGVATYDVEVSADGAQHWVPWLTGVSQTSGTYPGVPGQTHLFRVMARDAVGNEQADAVAPFPAKTLAACDLVAPRTTATAAAGAVGGWYGGPVDVSLDAVDAPGGSGVASVRWAQDDELHTIQGASTTARVTREGATAFTFSAVDAKGNVEANATLPIRIDTTAPVISGTDGVAYTAGQAAAPDATCSDAGSGIATCDVPAALNTSAVGTFSYSVNATDKLGHAASRTFAYTVAAQVEQPRVTPVPTATPTPAPTFGKTPIKAKLGKVTKTTVALTLTSAEKFAFTGKATLLSTAKKPKAQSGAGSFSLAVGKSGKVVLKLNAAGKKALKAGKQVKLVLRLELKSGAAKKTVEVKLTVRAAR